jgi:hypothetical protein
MFSYNLTRNKKTGNYQMELSKLIILPTFLLTIASCGGGGDSTATPAPPVQAPPVTTVADFPITADNQKTVRYYPNHSISYSTTLSFRDDPEIITGAYIESYSYSNSPSIFRDGEAETITKSETFTFDGQAFSRTYEVIQFPEDWNQTPSSSQFAYSLREDGVTFNIGYNSSDGLTYGALTLPGFLGIGYQFNQTYDKRRTDNGSIRNVVENLSVNEIEIVQTDIGTFDAFKMERVYTETSSIGNVDSTVGTFWIHPSIGVIKAKYTVTENINLASTNVFDIEYVLTNTNLSY